MVMTLDSLQEPRREYLANVDPPLLGTRQARGEGQRQVRLPRVQPGISPSIRHRP